MSAAGTTLGHGQAPPGTAPACPPGPGARFAARLIRLRHSRGRLLYAILLAFLTGVVLNGPLDVLFSVAWFLSEGFSAPSAGLRAGVVCISFTAILALLYAALWAVTMLLALPLRAITEWLATLVFLGATLTRYAPGFIAAVPNWALMLTTGSLALSILLRKTGLAFRPLHWPTRHHRTRFSLPLPPQEAYARLRARPGRPHWDAGWAEITEATPGDDSLLRIEVRRRAGAMTLWLRYTDERPGREFAVQSALHPDDFAAKRAGVEYLRFSPQGAGGCLVEVTTREPHTLATLTSDPMEDRSADYWAHAAARISGRPDGTFAAALLRPAKPQARPGG